MRSSPNDKGSSGGIGESIANRGRIVVLNTDLFFGVKIGNQLRAQGFSVSFQKNAEAFADQIRVQEPVLGLIDLNARPDWTTIAAVVAEAGVRTPILVFGSHLDVEGLRAAKSAGVRRVVSNGEFHQHMLALVDRYARVCENEPLDAPASEPDR